MIENKQNNNNSNIEDLRLDQTNRPTRINGSDLLTAVQVANAQSIALRPSMIKTRDNIMGDNITAEFPKYEISGKSQGKHEANHYISLSLVHDMLRDSKFCKVLSQIALKYSLDLGKPSDFSLSGERLPLILDGLFFNTISHSCDEEGNKCLNFDLSKYPFIDENIKITDLKVLNILAQDIHLNIDLANDEVQRKDFYNEFYDNFLSKNLSDLLLSNRDLTITILEKLGDRNADSIKAGLNNRDRYMFLKLSEDITDYSLTLDKGVKSCLLLFESMIKQDKKEFLSKVFKKVYCGGVRGVKGFSYTEDKKLEVNTARIRFFESNLEDKIGISYDDYAQSLVELGKIVWNFYQEDFKPENWEIVNKKGTLKLGDRATRIETDFNIFESSDKAFSYSSNPAGVDIDLYSAKSGDPKESELLRKEFKDIMNELKTRKEFILSRLNNIRENLGKTYDSDSEYIELQTEEHEINMIIQNHKPNPELRIWQIIDLMKVEYGVSALPY